MELVGPESPGPDSEEEARKIPKLNGVQSFLPGTRSGNHLSNLRNLKLNKAKRFGIPELVRKPSCSDVFARQQEQEHREGHINNNNLKVNDDHSTREIISCIRTREKWLRCVEATSKMEANTTVIGYNKFATQILRELRLSSVKLVEAITESESFKLPVLEREVPRRRYDRWLSRLLNDFDSRGGAPDIVESGDGESEFGQMVAEYVTRLATCTEVCGGTGAVSREMLITVNTGCKVSLTRNPFIAPSPLPQVFDGGGVDSMRGPEARPTREMFESLLDEQDDEDGCRWMTDAPLLLPSGVLKDRMKRASVLVLELELNALSLKRKAYQREVSKVAKRLVDKSIRMGRTRAFA